MSKISFIMPAKNRGYIIKESIQSIINQTVSDWELVIIDDHSDETDQTKKIVEEFADRRIVYVKLEDRFGKGVSCARNYGNFIAKSPILAVQDSDDLAMPNRAELVLNSYKEKGWDVFYGKYIRFSTAGEVIPQRQPIPFDIDKYLNRDFNIFHSSAAYTRKIALQYPYNSALNVAEDIDFFSRVAVDGKKFYFCPEFIYKYRIHENSLTGGTKKFIDIENIIIEARGWKKTS